MASLKLRLLGPPQIEIDDRRVEIKPRKALALLIYLACSEGYQGRDSVATLLWPESNQNEARAALRRRLSELGAALGGEWLEGDREQLRLMTGPSLWLDVAEFRKRIELYQSHAHQSPELCPDCLLGLTTAVNLAGGDFLKGFSLPDSHDFEQWRLFQSEALCHELAMAFARLVEWHESQEEPAAALGYARRWLALDPLQEDVHRHLMRLYARLDQRAAALRQFEECRRVLADELGVEPEFATESLYRELKSNPHRVLPKTSKDAEPARPSAKSTEPQTPRSFVGRENELAALATAMAGVRGAHGQIRFVTGEAGQGKSTLVQEFARQAEEADSELLVITGHCNAYTGIGDPYLPFRQAIALLAGEVEIHGEDSRLSHEQKRRLRAALSFTLPLLVDNAPELIGPFIAASPLLARASAIAAPTTPWVKQLATLAARPRATPLEEWAIFSQYAAGLRAIAAQRPLLLILEDLHWADQASCALLFHLSRALEGSRIMILATYRPDEIVLSGGAQRHPLAGMIGEFKRQHGAVWLDLSQLTPQEGRAFVDAYLDREPNRLDAGFRATFVRHTEGHALFTVELLQTLKQRGDLVQDQQGLWVAGAQIDWRALPAKVEGVVESQLARLDSTTQAILRVAAVQGESFDAELIAQVLHLDTQSVVQLLSQQLGRQYRLVNALEVVWLGQERFSRYSFRHFLFQSYLYQSLDEMERVYLHEAVGLTLERLYRDQVEQVAVQLAHHYRQAGRTEEAVTSLLLASDQAQKVAAYHESIQHLQQGLALLDALADDLDHQRLRLDFLMALAAAKNGTDFNPDGIEEVLLLARDLSLQLGEKTKLWPVLQGLYDLAFNRGDYQRARSYAKAIMEESYTVQDTEPRLVGHWLVGEIEQPFGDFATGLAHLEQALALYNPAEHLALSTRYGNHDIKDCILGNIAIMKWFLGYPDQANAVLDEELEYATATGNPHFRLQAILQQVWQHEMHREFAETHRYAEMLFELTTQRHHDSLLRIAQMYDGSVLIHQGQPEQGLASVQRALSGLRGTGVTLAPCHFTSIQVDGYIALRQCQEGIDLIDAALATVDQSGEHWFDGELRRKKGELLKMQGAHISIVEEYFEAAIAISRQQKNKMFEFRATVSLCRLWQEQGKFLEAYTTLSELYGWFSEGFNAPDLIEAKELLDSLEDALKPPSLESAMRSEDPWRPFVGREKELDTLATAMDKARSGQGQLRFVVGEAGQGKSMLVQEFVMRAMATDERLLVVSGQCNTYSDIGDPYLPFREVIAQLAGEGPGESEVEPRLDSPRHRLKNALALTLPVLIEEAADLIGPFVAASALYEHAVGVAPQHTPWVTKAAALSTSTQTRSLDERAIFWQYTAALKAIASRRPLLLVLEDLHWADPSSCALLFHLCRSLDNSPIFILGTYRPEEITLSRGTMPHPLAEMLSEFKRQHGNITLDLNDLSAEESNHFVNAYLDSQPNQFDASFREAFFHHTGGHALFTVELLDSLRERGFLVFNSEQRWVVGKQIEWHSLPAKVEGVIEKRFMRLDALAQSVLRVAAVQGESFDAEVISGVLQLDLRSVFSKLSEELGRQHRLVNAQKAIALGSLRLSRYRFRHILFQEYLYQSLDEMERTYLHDAVGSTLEGLYSHQVEQVAVQLALHYRQAGRVEKAVSALLLAGQRSRQIAAYQEAVNHLTSALDLLQIQPDPQQELICLVNLGGAMDAGGNFSLSQIEEVFQRAYRLCRQVDESTHLWQVLFGLFWNSHLRGQYLRSHGYAEEALRLSLEQPKIEPRLIANLMMGSTLWVLGDFTRSIAHFEDFITSYKPVEHHTAIFQDNNIDFRNDLAVSQWLAGYPDQACRNNEMVLNFAEELKHPFTLAKGLLQAVWQHEMHREISLARSRVTDLIQLATQHQFYGLLPHARICEASVMIAGGEIEDGVAQLHQNIAELHDSGYLMGICHHATMQARGYAELGKTQARLEIIDAALAQGELSGEHWMDAELHRLRGCLLKMQGAPAQSIQNCFEHAIEIARRQQAKMWELRATVSLCRHLHEHGRTAEAYTRLAELYDWFTEGFGMPDLLEAKALLISLEDSA